MADLKHVQEQALELEPEARASLVDTLMESLGVETSEAATQAWFQEVRRRRSEVADGTVQLISGDEFLATLDHLA
jgi:hypothetical protein